MVDRLSHREIEIVVALAEGLTNREIAERVGIGEDAVAIDLSRVLRKLGLRNWVQVAVWAVKQGLYWSTRWRERRC